MAKSVSSFRIDDRQIRWLHETAAHLNTTKAQLLEDAIGLAQQTHTAAGANFGSMIQELIKRYGDNAVLLTWVDEVDGKAVAGVHLDGEARDDLRGHVKVDVERGQAHVFLEFDAWSMTRFGSACLGPDLVATLPLRPAAVFPWPIDKSQPAAARATLGQILRGGAQAPELDEL